MAFDGDRIAGVLVQPLRLARQHLLRIGADHRRIEIEENPVAHADGELLLRSGRTSGTAKADISSIVGNLLVSATGQGKGRHQGDANRVFGDSCNRQHCHLSFRLEIFCSTISNHVAVKDPSRNAVNKPLPVQIRTVISRKLA